MYQRIAIITGSSSGIGKAFVELLAKDNGEFFKSPFDEIWAVARREDALNELAESVQGIKIVPVVADLSDDSGIQVIKDKLKSEEPKVGLLINSAGMGIKGKVMDKSDRVLDDTISINCSALSRMMRITVPYMKSDGVKPGIINIASSAGFLPQPGFAAYAASKSYVISFSRAMSYELKSLGISVTAVCPGPVRTDFQRRATEGREADFNDWRKNFVIDPVKLARVSLKASVKGKRMLVYPFSQKMLHLASKILPVSWILGVSSNM
jgi:short-subunit dehydrogenase